MFIFLSRQKTRNKKNFRAEFVGGLAKILGEFGLEIFGIFGDLVRGKLKQITSHCLPYKQTNKKDILKKFNNQFLGG